MSCKNCSGCDKCEKCSHCQKCKNCGKDIFKEIIPIQEPNIPYVPFYPLPCYQQPYIWYSPSITTVVPTTSPTVVTTTSNVITVFSSYINPYQNSVEVSDTQGL